MGQAANYIGLKQAAVKRERGVEPLEFGINRAGEAPAPKVFPPVCAINLPQSA
jgi:hypothetical protein